MVVDGEDRCAGRRASADPEQQSASAYAPRLRVKLRRDDADRGSSPRARQLSASPRETTAGGAEPSRHRVKKSARKLTLLVLTWCAERTYRRNVSKNAEIVNASPAWDPQRPYDALPPLPPGVELESRQVLKRCVSARAGARGAPGRRSAHPEPGRPDQHPAPPRGAGELGDRERHDHRGRAVQAPRRRRGGRPRHPRGAALPERPPRGGAAASTSARSRPRPPRRSARGSRATTMMVRSVPGTRIASARTGAVVYTPPERKQSLRDLLDQLGGVPPRARRHRRARPARADGRRALPVRGDPPLHRRQRSNGTRHQQPLPRRSAGCSTGRSCT